GCGPREQQVVEGSAPYYTGFLEFGCILLRDVLNFNSGGLPTFQRLGTERLWPPAGRDAKLTRAEGDPRGWNVVVARGLFELSRVCIRRNQCQCKIGHHLRRRGDFYDVAENVISCLVHVFYIFKPLPQS